MDAFSQDIREEFPLGPCKVLYNGNNLGHTDESTKLVLKASVVTALAAKYGKASVGEYLNGQQAEVDCVLMQNDMTILATAIPGATKVTNVAGASKLTFGKIAGQVIPSYTLQLVPENGTSNPATLNLNWTMQASPVGDFEAVYDGGKIAGYKVKFRGIINETGAAAGAYSGTFGDTTITADVVNPTMTAISPLLNATAVAADAVIVATISEALAGNTVNTSTVVLIKDPTGTPVFVPGSVALVNAGAATTITFTPTSALTLSKDYVFDLSPLITDQNGNALGTAGAGEASNFDTNP